MTIIEKLESMGFKDLATTTLSENELYYDVDIDEVIGCHNAAGPLDDMINIKDLSEAQILDRAETLLRWSKE